MLLSWVMMTMSVLPTIKKCWKLERRDLLTCRIWSPPLLVKFNLSDGLEYGGASKQECNFYDVIRQFLAPLWIQPNYKVNI